MYKYLYEYLYENEYKYKYLYKNEYLYEYRSKYKYKCVNVVNIEKTTFNGGSQKIYKLTDTTDTKDLGGSFLMGHQRGAS